MGTELSSKSSIIHCDRCYAICISMENFCSVCRRERKDFVWGPVDLNSPQWWEREAIRSDQGREPYVMAPFHCDACYAVLSIESDAFCGYCGKLVSEIEWPYIEDIADPEFWVREGLRTSKSDEEKLCQKPL